MKYNLAKEDILLDTRDEQDPDKDVVYLISPAGQVSLHPVHGIYNNHMVYKQGDLVLAVKPGSLILVTKAKFVGTREIKNRVDAFLATFKPAIVFA